MQAEAPEHEQHLLTCGLAELDFWAAVAKNSWSRLHCLFPTFTLTPQFCGVRLVNPGDGAESYAQLIPKNAFRQDPQVYSPTRSHEHCMDLVLQHKISVIFTPKSSEISAYCFNPPLKAHGMLVTGESYHEVATRAFVLSHLTVEEFNQYKDSLECVYNS